MEVYQDRERFLYRRLRGPWGFGYRFNDKWG
jgi:hypothetical protein